MQLGIRAAEQELSKKAAGAVLGQGERILAKQGMKRVGLWMLRLGAWEVTLVLTSIEIFVWVISPDELEKWCESNIFGKAKTDGFLGFGNTEPLYKSLEKQEDAFQKALGDIGVGVK
ncbi:hypothetical protein EBA01_12935 [Xanthomonas oryzae pv. oryzae]|nr:hypothetical protein C0L89_12930 [Xanthomonas oryzae pv. oryzae]QBN28791.1 hypothetical protein EBA01_12935 [Xanthomonas oryzae pv. oryzae]QBN61537.1 hypothetical protein EBA10_12965 [Xanthomonas oryzae pv. oryzae]QBN65176.1 hypothetical protein EBA11_12895 [Xanthomonas oryzae pv. oryzae]